MIVGVLILAVGGAVALRRDHAPSSTAASAPAAVALPRLVDLGSDQCIPCKAMVPVLEDLRRESAGRLRVDFIDAWKHPEAAEPFKVYAIPVQVFLDPSGRELRRHLGFFSKDDIVRTWRNWGYFCRPRGRASPCRSC